LCRSIGLSKAKQTKYLAFIGELEVKELWNCKDIERLTAITITVITDSATDCCTGRLNWVGSMSQYAPARLSVFWNMKRENKTIDWRYLTGANVIVSLSTTSVSETMKMHHQT
jgi:hypothetical protein